MTAGQILDVRDHTTVFHICRSAESPEALQVLVNRTTSDITAAGKRNFRMAVLAKQRAHQIVTGTDLLNIGIIHADGMNIATVKLYTVRTGTLYDHADLLHSI